MGLSRLQAHIAKFRAIHIGLGFGLVLIGLFSLYDLHSTLNLLTFALAIAALLRGITLCALTDPHNPQMHGHGYLPRLAGVAFIGTGLVILFVVWRYSLSAGQLHQWMIRLIALFLIVDALYSLYINIRRASRGFRHFTAMLRLLVGICNSSLALLLLLSSLFLRSQLDLAMGLALILSGVNQVLNGLLMRQNPKA